MIKKLIASALALSLVFGGGLADITGSPDLGSTLPVNAEDSANKFFTATQSAGGSGSRNMGANDYVWYSATTVKSYIDQNSDGTVTRAEYYGGSLIVETYKADGSALISSKTISPELPLFGGVFFGKDNIYVVWGQNNTSESDSTEILRVSKYSYSWEKLSSASVCGANTYIPFSSGSLRMTENAGKLYIHTCHKMYTTSDGLNHQANMTFTVNESTMAVEQKQYAVSAQSAGYISHSFNQFIKTDGTKLYRLDHGDYYPRCVYLTAANVGAALSKVTGRQITDTFPMTSNYNYTNCLVGGMELSADNVLAAYSSIDQANYQTSTQYNVFLAVQDKALSKACTTIQITSYPEKSGITVGNPQLVSVDDNTLLLLWQETKDTVTTVKCAAIDGSGKLLTDIATLDAALSDCQPVCFSDNTVRWYVTSRSNPTPIFYSIDMTKLLNPDAVTPGDLNGDGKINMRDYVAMQRILLDSTPAGISEEAADLNGDGKINMQDYVIMQRMLLKA